MKVKIIAHNDYKYIWYEVKYRHFLFWHSVKDAYGFPREYYAIEDAKEACFSLLHKKTTKEVLTMKD